MCPPECGACVVHLMDRQPLRWRDRGSRARGFTSRLPSRPILRTTRYRNERCPPLLDRLVESRFVSFENSRIISGNIPMWRQSCRMNGTGEDYGIGTPSSGRICGPQHSEQALGRMSLLSSAVCFDGRVGARRTFRTARDNLCHLTIMLPGMKARGLPGFIRSRPDGPCPMLERPHETNREESALVCRNDAGDDSLRSDNAAGARSLADRARAGHEESLAAHSLAPGTSWRDLPSSLSRSRTEMMADSRRADPPLAGGIDRHRTMSRAESSPVSPGISVSSSVSGAWGTHSRRFQT